MGLSVCDGCEHLQEMFKERREDFSQLEQMNANLVKERNSLTSEVDSLNLRVGGLEQAVIDYRERCEHLFRLANDLADAVEQNRKANCVDCNDCEDGNGLALPCPHEVRVTNALLALREGGERR